MKVSQVEKAFMKAHWRFSWEIILNRLTSHLKNIITLNNRKSFLCDSKSVWLCYSCRAMRDKIKFGRICNPYYVFTKHGVYLVGKKHE